MYSYADLKTELTTDPLTRGYANMTDAAAAGSLTTADIGVTVDVPVASVMNTLMVRGVWPAIELLSRGAETADTTHDNALKAAVALVRLVTATPSQSVMMTDATTKAVVEAELAALVAEGTIAQADSDAVLALAAVTVSRASQIGWPGGVSAADVTKARSPA